MKDVMPKVATADLTARNPVVIVVDRKRFTLRLFKRLRLARKYRVGVGRAGFETPRGLYHVESMAVDPAWYVPEKEWAGELAGEVVPAGDPGNPIKARWMGFYDGAGIHGTSDTASLGTNASHGCIRMSIPEVKRLFRQVKLETPVYIA